MVHPPLWPFLVGLAILLSLALWVRIRYLEAVHARYPAPGDSRPPIDTAWIGDSLPFPLMTPGEGRVRP